MNYKNKLLAILKEKSLQVSTVRTLASGKTSSWYIDCKITTLDSEGAFLIGSIICDVLKKLGNIDSIGGPGVGASSIIGSIMIANHIAEVPIKGFTIHQGEVGGYAKFGYKTVILEDVTSTGKSAIEAIKILQKIKCKVIAVITLIDREQGAREAIESNGVKFIPIFTKKDLLS
jgi:orotate phosphoribosyltransferase